MKQYFTTQWLCVLMVIIAGSFSAVAQKKGKLTPEEKENLKTAKVKLYRFNAPPLYFMTPKSAVGEGIVADLTKSDLADSVEKYHYYPNKLVQYYVDSLMRAEGLMANIELVEEPFEFQMAGELKDLSKYEGVDADYIVELIVNLMAWTASYSPAKWKQYSLNLGVEMRIYKKDGNIRIWKTIEGYGGTKDDRLKFHIDDMQEDGKEKLTVMRDIVTKECAIQLVEAYKSA